jgi:hypothetical protein
MVRSWERRPVEREPGSSDGYRDRGVCAWNGIRLGYQHILTWGCGWSHIGVARVGDGKRTT